MSMLPHDCECRRCGRKMDPFSSIFSPPAPPPGPTAERRLSGSDIDLWEKSAAKNEAFREAIGEVRKMMHFDGAFWRLASGVDAKLTALFALAEAP